MSTLTIFTISVFAVMGFGVIAGLILNKFS